MQPAEGGDLHGGEGRVAHHGGHDAQADGDPFGAGQGCGCCGDPAGIEAVFHNPQLIKADGFGLLCKPGQAFGVLLAAEHDAQADVSVNSYSH